LVTPVFAAVLVAATLVGVSACATAGANTSPAFTPAPVGARARPTVSPDPLPPLSRFVTNPDGSQVTTVSADYLFDINSDVVVDGALAALEQIMSQIRAHDGTIVVTGFTDGLGPTQHNLELSQRRADAVKQWLVSQGISEQSVDAVGKGEQGAADNVADAHRRRVEITLQ
jgi:peptidoglycan-associated lipoprotein